MIYVFPKQLVIILSLFYMPFVHLLISAIIVSVVLFTGRSIYTIARIEKMKEVLEKENE